MSPKKLSADINQSCDLITGPLKLTQNTENRDVVCVLHVFPSWFSPFPLKLIVCYL